MLLHAPFYPLQRSAGQPAHTFPGGTHVAVLAQGAGSRVHELRSDIIAVGLAAGAFRELHGGYRQAFVFTHEAASGALTGESVDSDWSSAYVLARRSAIVRGAHTLDVL